MLVVPEVEEHLDIHALFQLFDAQYFSSRLASVEVRWSPRMTLCAGICVWSRGGYCSIRLSEPLLQFRPRSDLINTLLHEMIHAYLFLTNGVQDRDGHGPSFVSHMERINRQAGTTITIYHSFHDEVDYHRQHVWLCDGPCRHRPPFFGLVKRSMNRAPQPADTWFARHRQECGGTFTKIKEPVQKVKASKQERHKKAAESSKQHEGSKDEIKATSSQPKIDALFKKSLGASQKTETFKNERQKLPFIDLTQESPDQETNTSVSCPSCCLSIPFESVNEHLDNCLSSL